mmetsp:Transcript_77192/g.153059  ORF Transcript_77192/g.153059 Transcript_77192/m.153059 type:complete len:215 (-) Transcript_77192:890-1534(-)
MPHTMCIGLDLCRRRRRGIVHRCLFPLVGCIVEQRDNVGEMINALSLSSQLHGTHVMHFSLYSTGLFEAFGYLSSKRAVRPISKAHCLETPGYLSIGQTLNILTGPHSEMSPMRTHVRLKRLLELSPNNGYWQGNQCYACKHCHCGHIPSHSCLWPNIAEANGWHGHNGPPEGLDNCGKITWRVIFRTAEAVRRGVWFLAAVFPVLVILRPAIF